MQIKNKQLWSAALLLAATAFFAAPLKAQVTIGAQRVPNSTLEVTKLPTTSGTPDGIMAPQLTGDELKAADGKYQTPQNGALVYVTLPVTTASTKTVNVKKPGYYYYDAPNNVWVAVGAGKEEWFYMPSFNLPLNQTSFNLYDEYVRQFKKQATNPQFLSSDGVSTTITDASPLPLASLTFFVTAYSSDVITVTGLDSDGTLHYTPNTDVVPDGSFINVIFKVK